ncbi:MAG: ATP-binding protein, partial [Gemmatimonadaceae bacterium]
SQAMSMVYFLIEPALAAHAIDYSCAPCDAALAVKADRERLQQILVNLLSNAAKFSPAGGRVAVTAESREHLVAIHVTDEGEGIANDMLESIFHPFVQASSGLTRTSNGSGLGLSISRELARLMGGDITVRSKRHEGSEFTVTLPMSPPVIPVS